MDKSQTKLENFPDDIIKIVYYRRLIEKQTRIVSFIFIFAQNKTPIVCSHQDTIDWPLDSTLAGRLTQGERESKSSLSPLKKDQIRRLLLSLFVARESIFGPSRIHLIILWVHAIRRILGASRIVTQLIRSVALVWWLENGSIQWSIENNITCESQIKVKLSNGYDLFYS